MRHKFLLAFSVLLFQFSTLADTETVNGIVWYYRVSNGKALLGSGTSGGQRAIDQSTTGAIAIPATLGGCPVTSVGNYAFYYCSKITGVSIPSSIKTVGKYAFCGCSSLTSLPAIPKGVTSIGDYAFSQVSGIKTKTLILPDGLKTVGERAFNFGTLTTLSIPASVTSIGANAFNINNVTTITIPGHFPISHTAFNASSGQYTIKAAIIANGSTNVAERAFLNYRTITSATIPEGVTSIGKYAFSGCTSLTTITIPYSVTTISKSAFEGCTALTTIIVRQGWENSILTTGIPSGCNVVIDDSAIAINDVSVPKIWMYRNAYEFVKSKNQDYDKAATTLAANGRNKVWECYVAGLNPNKTDEYFRATIGFDESGNVKVSWWPDLNENGTKNERTYMVEGKPKLADEWGSVNTLSRFFRVKVRMP